MPLFFATLKRGSLAGTFLVDQSGTVRLAFVDPGFTRRLDPSVIVSRLNELKG